MIVAQKQDSVKEVRAILNISTAFHNPHLESRSRRASRRKLKRTAPTLDGVANQGSRMKIGITLEDLAAASTKAALSCRRRDLRNHTAVVVVLDITIEEILLERM